MGKEEFFKYGSTSKIWDEVRQVWEKGHGITYERIENAGLQWPCTAESHPGTQMLHTTGFAIGPRAILHSIDYLPTAETVNEQYPFLLTTGRTLFQFNAGTMTMRTPNRVLYPEDFLRICSEDASRLGVALGERVRIRSRYGQTELSVRISSEMKPGELFATFHTVEAALNLVTGPYRDSQVDTPEYKVTAVQIEKVAAAAEKREDARSTVRE